MNKDRYKYKLFGRFRGRKKISNLIPKNFNNFDINIKNQINKNIYNILDIGSGSGENSIHLSKSNIKSFIVACELFEDGNINLCNEIVLNNIINISIYRGNVLEFLDTLKDILIFDEVWILFPDPWPKIRHQKRRLINNMFLKNIHLFMKKSGKLMIASDSKSYIHSIMKNIYNAQSLYLWKNQNFYAWNYDFLNLPKTKFNEKAIKMNRNSMFFELIKI